MFKVFQKLQENFITRTVLTRTSTQHVLLRQILKYGISTCFKPHQTLRQLLVTPKDKAKVQEQPGVVYRIPCEECNKVYVGETKRTLGERSEEHTANIANNLSAVAEKQITSQIWITSKYPK